MEHSSNNFLNNILKEDQDCNSEDMKIYVNEVLSRALKNKTKNKEEREELEKLSKEVEDTIKMKTDNLSDDVFSFLSNTEIDSLPEELKLYVKHVKNNSFCGNISSKLEELEDATKKCEENLDLYVDSLKKKNRKTYELLSLVLKKVFTGVLDEEIKMKSKSNIFDDMAFNSTNKSEKDVVKDSDKKDSSSEKEQREDKAEDDYISNFFSAVGGSLENVVDGVLSSVDDAINIVKDVSSSVVCTVSDVTKDAAEKITDTSADIAKTVVESKYGNNKE